MGFDKRNLQVNGESLMQHLFNLLNNQCDEVYTSCKKESPVAKHFNPIFDHYDFGGPLNGILSAMEFVTPGNLLILAIDQPFVTKIHLDALCTTAGERDPIVAFQNSLGNSIEPFPSLWKSATLPLLQDFIKTNKPSPMDFMKTTSVHLIQSPDNRFLINLNRPEDLSAFKDLRGSADS
jgi:molybdopterin-guanine dinucleotide biosynthesis protein A